MIKGTNYIPSSAAGVDNVTGLLSYDYVIGPAIVGEHGLTTFSELQCSQELQVIAEAGLNNIRLHGSFYGWVINSTMYMNNLRFVCEQCALRGISVTYQVWTGPEANGGRNVYSVFRSLSAPPQVHQENLQLLVEFHAASRSYHDFNRQNLPAGEDWWAAGFAEPGTAFFYLSEDYRTWGSHPLLPQAATLPALIEAYLADIGAFFGRGGPGAPVFHAYDLFNEPDIVVPFAPWIINRFIADTFVLLSRAHGGLPACTVGYAGNSSGTVDLCDDLVNMRGVPLTYFSYHCYPGGGGQAAIDQFRSLAVDLKSECHSRLGLEILCSEFEGVLHNPGLLPDFLRVLLELSLPAQMWGFVQSNYFAQQGARYIAWDGVAVPTWPGSYGAPLGFSFTGDLAAVREWTATP